MNIFALLVAFITVLIDGVRNDTVMKAGVGGTAASVSTSVIASLPTPAEIMPWLQVTASLVGILVSFVTLIYVGLKTYRLLKAPGKTE